ncbi:MAG: nicotinate-nucleotide adenylyltransferase [Leptolyngbyaceae cyanobacterium MO_188.B28]|nr:nicotinate-nucleotide adenylyltransferase [Leptolyngbyaceae cyanobacterium MO_188.B28]
MIRIALFGTSADPPHQGHQAIMRWLSQTFDYVAVWAADNPFKTHQTPLVNRTAMLGLLIDEIQPHPRNIQLHLELSHPRSIFTIELARQRWPDAAFTLVVGADIVHQLPHWYRSQDIFKQVQILVFPRPGYPLDEDGLMELRQQGANVEIANMPQMYDVSSTEYRTSEEISGLPPAIQAYIDQNNLYSCQENSREKLSTH